jgi:predicted dehydrogenase
LSLQQVEKYPFMKKLRIGLMGIGFIADFHYHGFKQNPDAEITGLCHVLHGR